MYLLEYNRLEYTVDHAVKGPDYIHGYDAAGNLIVSFEGVTDFEDFVYDGEFMDPEHCLEESCNVIRNAAGQLVRQDGTVAPISQGRGASYKFYTPGWKRVLNIIRGSGGVLNLCYGQSSPLYMAQVAGVVFSGFVKYGGDTRAEAKPVLYQLYNNIFGSNAALERPGSIKKVRIGYPDPNQANYNNGTSSGLTNPINCYLDVYVDFDTSKLSNVGFQMNYSGFADNHHCKAINVETNAVDTGVYGEKLVYYELELKQGTELYMPEGALEAKQIHKNTEEVWSGVEVADKICPAIQIEGNKATKLVICEPVEKYPLRVTTDLDATTASLHTLMHSGKNMLSKGSSVIPTAAGATYTKNGVTFTVLPDGSIKVFGECTTKFTVLIGSVKLPPGEYTYSFGYTGCATVYGQLHKYIDSTDVNFDTVITGIGNKNSKATFSLAEPTIVRSRIYCAVGTCDAVVHPQIELGNVATEYEQHHSVDHVLELVEAKYRRVWWDKGECEYIDEESESGVSTRYFTPHKFPAFPGTNILYTFDSAPYVAELSGRANPAKKLESVPNIYSGTQAEFEALGSSFGQVGDIFIVYDDAAPAEEV